MSIERELLERCLDEFQYHEVPVDDLIIEIKELLAQPEQEPVAWEKEKKSYLDEIDRLGVESNRDEEEIDRLTQLLAQPEQEPVAWIMHNKETGYRVQAAYRPSALKKGWEAIPLYAGSPKREQEQHGTQYLLDQVSMLRAENAMLKEKWSTPKREPLSDEEMRAIWKEGVRGEIPFVEIGRAIEKAHGIGGGE